MQLTCGQSEISYFFESFFVLSSHLNLGSGSSAFGTFRKIQIKALGTSLPAMWVSLAHFPGNLRSSRQQPHDPFLNLECLINKYRMIDLLSQDCLNSISFLTSHWCIILHGEAVAM
jgi:hypothetical protein